MTPFIIERNNYLTQNIQAYYYTNYYGYNKENNPNYLNDFKNTYNSFSKQKLDNAVSELKKVLQTDLPKIYDLLAFESLTVCVVPRAKAESAYYPNQLLFKSTIREVINQLNDFNDGTDYIIRHTNTKTTHFKTPPPNYENDGSEPYRGISSDTCIFSKNINGRDILLIDDIYTKTVNIDEDMIQALLNYGANSVTFYAIGNTIHNHY